MSWSIFKRNPVHVHNWETVAFDTGYSITGAGHYHVRYQKCSGCGERKFITEKTPSNWHKIEDHSVVVRSKEKWVAGNWLQLTDESVVFDDNYVCTIAPGNSTCGKWVYAPITDAERALRQLRQVPEFQELTKHQMVEDALKQLETVVAMHENIKAKDDDDEE